MRERQTQHKFFGYVEQDFDGNNDQIWRKIKYLLKKNDEHFTMRV